MTRAEQLFRRLAEAVAEREPGSPPPTIGDIYQSLVPYRLIRAELGFTELREYEDALLRLLGGEDGWLRVDEPGAAEEFRRELASPNPILGIYRDYAAVPVQLTRALPPEPGTAAAPAAAETPASSAAAAPTAEPTAASAAAAASTAHRPGRLCAACSAPLPEGVEARFCPFCGANRVRVDCERCGASVEPGWSFCARCGARRGPAAP